MKIKLIGTGAAGNKALINLVEKDIIAKDSMLLINSTLRDVPSNYRTEAFILTDDSTGCGKERDLAGTLCYRSIEEGKLDGALENFIQEDDELVVVVNSSEGGTGSGSAHIVAKYTEQVIGKPVIRFVFTGFEEDGRGLQNTIEYFQDTDEESVVQMISNKMFLEETPNKLKAEKLANDEFAKRIEVLLNKGIVDSEQNIDLTDYLKIVKTPGFMISDSVQLPKLKNMKQFNDVLSDLIDNNKSLNKLSDTAKRIGVYVNVRESNSDYIDYTFKVLKDKLGSPYELFLHIQDNDEIPEMVSYIASGMNMPIEEVKDVYEKYKIESEKVNKKADTFFSEIGFKGNIEDTMFNSASKQEVATKKDKKDFLSSLKKKPSAVQTNLAQKTEKLNKEAKELFDSTGKKVTTSKKEFLKNNY